MGHAEHYLRRVDRLDAAHTELALALYRDHELVATLLKRQKLPDGEDRVAISLDDPVEGPFVIVTRDGHFVTCLGRGMHVRKGQPIVQRGQLDRLSDEIQSLRELMEESKGGRLRKTGEFLASLETCGPGLSREQFEDAARWVPLLGARFLCSLLEVGRSCAERYPRLARIQNLDHKKHDHELHRYWCEVWAMGHYCLLLGSDGGQVLGRVLAGDDTPEDMLASATSVPGHFTFSTNVMPVALRGAWMIGHLPKQVLGPLKRKFTAARDLQSALVSGYSMLAIGARRARYRAEIGKVLDRSYEHEGEKLDRFLHTLRGLLAEYNTLAEKPAIREGAAEIVAGQGRAVVGELLEMGAEREVWGDPEALPEDVAVALALSLIEPLYTNPEAYPELAQRVLLTSHMPAEQFYLPERYVYVQRDPWTRQHTLALLQPRLDADGPKRLEKATARSDKTARNAPCPCGSGKKYKRCCGSASGRAGEDSAAGDA